MTLPRHLCSLVAVCCVLASASNAVGAELRIEVPIQPQALHDMYLAAWASGAILPARLQPRIVASNGTGTILSVTANCDDVSRFVFHASAFVSEVFEAKRSACEGIAQRLRVFRSASVTGEIVGLVRRGPVRGLLAVRRCTERMTTGAMAGMSYPLAIDERGRWGAEVPGECVDLQLVISSYAPIEWTSVLLAPRAYSSLGVRFVTATSSARLIVQDEKGAPAVGARVLPVEPPRWDQTIDRALSGEIKAQSAGVVTDATGVATVRGLKPGLVRFLVVGGGRALGFSDGLILQAGERHVVGPIVVAQPRRLTVRLDRAAASPPGPPVELRARPLIGGIPAGSSGVVVSPANEVAEFEGLFAGIWRITAVAKPESGLTQVTADIDVFIGEADTAITLPLFATRFTGQVLREGIPVAGRVELMAAADVPGVAFTALTGEDGLFQIQLPAPGRYHVFAYGPSDADSGVAFDVAFENPEEITTVPLSTATIAGEVVDPNGGPVSDVRVVCGYRERDLLVGLVERRLTTNAKGEFSATGLPEGAWAVTASDVFRASPTQLVKIRSDTEAKVRLTLHATTEVVGTVLTAGGTPVGGISGMAYLESPESPQLAQIVQFRTNDAGEFVLTLPQPVPQWLNLQLFGYERGLLARRVRPTARFDLRFPPAAGSVTLQFERSTESQPGAQLPGYALVNDDGGFIVLGFAQAFNQPIGVVRNATGVLAEIGYLAPGHWQMIELRPGQTVPWFVYGLQANDTVADFTVKAGMSQVVTVRQIAGR